MPRHQQLLITTQSPAEIEQWLIAQLGCRLGIPESEIAVDEPFERFGLDSAEAVELAGELEELTGQPVDATAVYDHPTIRALAGQFGASVKTRPELEPARNCFEPLAIVGVGCRLPGAQGVDELWRLLRDEVDAVTEVPDDRWTEDDVRGVPAARFGAFLPSVDTFDAAFFGISPFEAASLDPQQRLLLEVAWEALEDAGSPPAALRGTDTGVFVGLCTQDYAHVQHSRGADITRYTATGNSHSASANRLSYVLDLAGPSLAVDTACSSSLVALHLACQSIWAGESSAALVGGVNVMLTPEVTVSMAKLGALSPDGKVKAFDARADGYARGEGAAVVFIQPLSEARSAGNRIYAVVNGTAVNNDGRTNGLTAPSQFAQERAVRLALKRAGIAPAAIQYVEAHGAGTKLGDPIEAKALSSVLSQGRRLDQICALGSLKTNVGHLEAAAGIGALVKTALAIEKRAVPASLHFEQPNPHIPFGRMPLAVQRATGRWPQPDEPLIAGVSALGFGGTNAHAVLSEPH